MRAVVIEKEKKKLKLTRLHVSQANESFILIHSFAHSCICLVCHNASLAMHAIEFKFSTGMDGNECFMWMEYNHDGNVDDVHLCEPYCSAMVVIKRSSCKCSFRYCCCCCAWRILNKMWMTQWGYFYSCQIIVDDDDDIALGHEKLYKKTDRQTKPASACQPASQSLCHLAAS